MDFTIVTCLSPEFVDGIRIFMPSWFHNSGASEVKVRMVDGGVWYENILLRAEAMREEVLAAARTGGRVLCLDVDVFVLRGLSGGFSDRHPMSVARWPCINAGVLFFNTAVPFGWEGFFDELVDRLRTRCREYAKLYTADTKWRKMEGDQAIWIDLLLRNEGDVHRLDALEWNLCDGRRWIRLLEQHQDLIRVAHVKGHGRWNPKKIQAIRRLYPGKV